MLGGTDTSSGCIFSVDGDTVVIQQVPSKIPGFGRREFF
jgi:hypothetical protein